MSRERYSPRYDRYEEERDRRYRRNSYERSRPRYRSRSRERRPYRSRSRDRSYSPDRRGRRYDSSARSTNGRQDEEAPDSLVPPVQTVMPITRDKRFGDYRSSPDRRGGPQRDYSRRERSYSPPRREKLPPHRPLPHELEANYDQGDHKGSASPPSPYSGPVEKPDFGLSGALAKSAPMSALQDASKGQVVATNVRNGVELKWSNPPDMTLPDKKWRLYVFAGEDDLPPIPLHQSGSYLFGRDRMVADIPTDNPSCSKQHAVLFFRRVPNPKEPGDMGPVTFSIKPYILDLESANGTFLNGKKIDSARFVQLLNKDVLRFGVSRREYVLILEE